MKRGGAYYSTVATELINSHYNDLGETHIVNVNHHGTIRGWEQDWVVEMPCRVERSGIHPIPTEPLPLYCFVLLEQVKLYELVTIEAAVHGDYQAARRSLLTHPLGPEDEQVEEVLNDLLETNRAYLKNFSR
jgi:6-phospho-beta-glucosidase